MFSTTGDGVYLAGQHLATDDDGNGWTPEFDLDGQNYFLDPILVSNGLAAGQYTVFVTHCCGAYYTGQSSGVHSADNDYRLTFNDGAASVPEPSTLAIFALGIMGLASRRLKKTVSHSF
ncbi:MAG: PEP-CTERM sorting domain-containing protein [Colwellia sp.]|nr:PEP-CTERM sorting domain-containing protein [Colwellia sp.]